MTKQPEMANKPAATRKAATTRKAAATKKPATTMKTVAKAAPKMAAKPKAIPMSGVISGPGGQASAPVPKRQDKAAPGAAPEATPKAAPKVAPKAIVEQPKAQMPAARGVKGDDRLARFGKDGLQAYVRTGSIMVKGFEDFSREIAVYAQAALEVNVAAAKAMAQAGSFDEMLDLQTKAAHESIDIMLAEGAKLTELSLDLANKSMEPLQDQVDKTVATLLKPLAA